MQRSAIRLLPQPDNYGYGVAYDAYPDTLALCFGISQYEAANLLPSDHRVRDDPPGLTGTFATLGAVKSFLEGIRIAKFRAANGGLRPHDRP